MVSLKLRGSFYAALVLFCDAVAGSLGISVLPYFVAHLGGTPSQFGALISTFSSANILASLWIGAASDYLGRRPLILSSLVGISVGFLGTGLTPSMLPLFGARFTIGFFAGVGSTARAYIADISETSSERAAQMSRLGSLMLFGYAAGPPIGSALQLVVDALGFSGSAGANASAVAEPQGAQGALYLVESLSLRSPFLSGALLCICIAVLAFIRMPSVVEVKAEANEAAAAKAVAQDDSSALKDTAAPASSSAASPAEDAKPASFDARTVTALLLLLCYNALGQSGVSAFIVILPLFIEDSFGWGSGQFSILMTSFILGMAFTQLLVFPPLQKAVGLLRLAAVAAIVNGCAMFAFSLVDSAKQLPLWLGAISIQILCCALGGPVVNIKVAEIAPKTSLGLAMGLVTTSEQLGRILSSLGLAFAYDVKGSAFTYRLVAYATWASAVCMVLVALFPPSDPQRKALFARFQNAIARVSRQLLVSAAFTGVSATVMQRQASLQRQERREKMRALHVESSTGSLEGALMGYSPTKQQSSRTLVVLGELQTHEEEEAAAEEGAEAASTAATRTKADLL